MVSLIRWNGPVSCCKHYSEYRGRHAHSERVLTITGCSNKIGFLAGDGDSLLESCLRNVTGMLNMYTAILHDLRKHPWIVAVVRQAAFSSQLIARRCLKSYSYMSSLAYSKTALTISSQPTMLDPLLVGTIYEKQLWTIWSVSVFGPGSPPVLQRAPSLLVCTRQQEKVDIPIVHIQHIASGCQQEESSSPCETNKMC